MDSPLNRRVRAFLGLGPAPEEWSETLGIWVTQLRRRLERYGSAINWTPPENLHVTLRFFGSISQGDVLEIRERLKIPVSARQPFTMRAGHFALFPNETHPRVCAISLIESTGELEKLEAAVGWETAKIGQPREDRLFHPHVTFGRIRHANRWTQRIIGDLWEEGGIPELPDWDANVLTLFMSEVQENGPIYSPLAVLPLGPALAK